MNEYSQSSQSGLDTSTDPDISEGMAIEDYNLGRPNRAEHAPNPTLYRQGWDYAVAEAARERRATLITKAIW